MKTILATCYAVNPYKGSEDAMGWNFTYQIARHHKVISITRENNQTDIERYIKNNPDPIYNNITFLYFDLPYWMRFWKKGNRGAMLYYFCWQKGIVNFIKSKNLQFDIAHNVNFHNDWTPSFLYKLNKPMVWGPIGHHPKIPTAYFKNYSIKYYLIDRFTWMIKNIFWNLSPALQKTIQHSNHIWCMNSGVPKTLNLQKKDFSISPSVASEDFRTEIPINNTNFNFISVGRFVPLKGFDLTIESFAIFLKRCNYPDNCKLTIVGTGPEKNTYIQLIKTLQIEKYVEMVEWIDRKDLMNLYQQSTAFIFPSHEGAGMVVPEALSFHLPIITLANEGPGEFITPNCGFAIKQNNFENTTLQLSDALYQLYTDTELLHQMRANARKQYEIFFTWNSRGEKLKNIYEKLMP